MAGLEHFCWAGCHNCCHLTTEEVFPKRCFPISCLANIFLFFVSALFTWYPLWLQVIPPYNGYGFLEDSLQNCYSLFPKRPRKDVIKMLENDHKVLRYQVALVSPFLVTVHVSAHVVELEGWKEHAAQTRLVAHFFSAGGARNEERITLRRSHWVIVCLLWQLVPYKGRRKKQNKKNKQTKKTNQKTVRPGSAK